MIMIDDDLIVDVDECGYALKIKKELHKNGKGKKKGKRKTSEYKTIGYFQRLKDAIEYLSEETFKDRISGGEISLEQACATIKEANKTWKSLIDELLATNGWFLCENRLPIHDCWTVVTIRDDLGNNTQPRTDFGLFISSVNYWIVNGEVRPDVEAWRPLPAPYISELYE